jgi:biopolymer transport protein TolQ
MHLVLASTGILDLLAHSGYVAKAVLLVLLVFSIISWAIIVDRTITYIMMKKRAVEFYSALKDAGKVTDLLNTARRSKDSPLKEIFLETYRELHDQVRDQLPSQRADNPNVPGDSPDGQLQIKHADNLERTLQKAISEQTLHMESGLAFLATTASATPFIGLFGTVWGIMEAFQAIGQTGSATLSSVAPGISEALIATAAGLFAAIPALVAYNLLGRRIKAFRLYMEQFSLDLINFLVNRFA